MTTNDLVKINKDFFVKITTTAALAAVFSALPFLLHPPLNIITNKAVSYIVNQVADQLELISFFIYIDFRTAKQGKEYVLAAHEADRLKTEESRRMADEAFKRFVRFNT